MARGLLSANAIWMYLFLYAPIVLLVVFSFNASRFLSVFRGFTLQWYARLFQDAAIGKALTNSLIVALSSTAISTVIGTMVALVMERHAFPGKLPFDALLYLPIIIPEISMAVMLLLFFVLARIPLGLPTIIIAHVSFNISYVAVVVRARLAGCDTRLEEAAQDLGANGWQAFRRITLPLMMPGILAGALLAFTFQQPPYDPGNAHCVPYLWGTTGIGYNNETFPNPPDSWAYLFDPAVASPYAGKISMLNDSREAIGAALKYLGYSLNSTDPAQLEQAKQLLLQQKPWVSTYDTEQFEDLLMTGDVVLAHAWSGDIFMAAVEDERLWYAIPKEGSTIWADNLCIPRTSANKYTAELFINYLLRPQVAAKISNFTWYASPVQAAEPYINPDIRDEPAIYPPEEVMARLEWIQDVGEATSLYDRIWTEVRAH